MDKDTESFLHMLNKQNESIAAREAKKEAEKEARKVPPDLIRLERDQERREKWGQLRAREQSNRRPRRSRRLFGFVDLSSND